MIGSAACADSIFLDCSQERRRLARADDPRLCALDRRRELRGRTRDASRIRPR
jgi:hypothetical protein